MNKLHDQATPEEISTHLNDFMSNVGKNSSLSSEQAKSFKSVIDHPNFSKEHYDSILNAYVSPDSVSNKDVVNEIINSKHFTPQDGTKILQSAVNGGEVDSGLAYNLSKIPGVDKSSVEQSAHSFVNDNTKDVKDASDYRYHNLSPKFLREMFESRPEYTQGENLTPEQEAQNKKAHKIDNLALNALVRTNAHNPESLNHIVDLVMNDKIKNHSTNWFQSPGWDDDAQKELIENLVENQKGLDQGHLNRLFEKAKSLKSAKSWKNDDEAAKILKHPNVDPILLSKMAKKKKEGYRDDYVSNALANPNLPHESINSIINDDEELHSKSDELFRNPSLTKDQLQALFDKGYGNDVINHRNADAGFHRNYWNGSDKSTEVANNLVKAKNTPPDVLKEIVNHKNQDVAIKALKHENSDKSVVEAGLNRKAFAVQDEARKHPLVADQEMKRAFAEDKYTLADVLSDPYVRKHFDKLSSEEKAPVYEKMSEKLKGDDVSAAADDQSIDHADIWRQKFHLATNPEAPAHVREQHSNDIVSKFDKQTENNASNFSYGKDDEYRTVHSGFGRLLTQGNKKAEEVALSKPGYIQNFSDHFNTEDLDKMSPDFLDKAYDRINNSVGEQTVNERGMVKRLTDQDIQTEKKNMLKSRNIPESKLDMYMATAPTDSLDHLTVNNRTLRDGTILDKRYEGLPEDEKRAMFQKHMDEGRHMAVAASDQAPQDMRDQAFTSLSPEKKNELVKDYDNGLRGFSDQILEDSLFGKNNSPDQSTLEHEKSKNDGLSSMETNALNRLDPNNENHKAILNKFLQHAAVKEGKFWDQPGDTGIQSALSRSWTTDHPEFFKAHANAFPRLYLDSVRQHLANKMSRSYLGDKEANDSVDYLKKEAADYASLGITPEGQKEREAEFWNHLIGKYDNRSDFFSEPVAKIVGHKQKSRESNGKLDFLVDLAKNDKLLKAHLLSKQLLSGPAAEDLANSFQNYGEYLRSLTDNKKRDVLRSKVGEITKGKVDPSQLSYIFSHINPQDLRGELGPSDKLSFNKEHMPVIENNLRKMYDIASEYGHGADYIQGLLTNGGSTVKDSEHLIKTLYNHITENSAPEELGAKNAEFYKTLSYLEDVHSKTLTPSLVNKITDVAVANGDTITLAGIVQNEKDISKNSINKINGLAKDSAHLNSGELSHLSRLADWEHFDPKGLKSIDHNFENAVNRDLTSGTITPEQAGLVRSAYVGNLSNVNPDSSQDMAETASSILQKYRTFPDVANKATVALQKYVASDKLNVQQRKNIYLSLPDSILGANRDFTNLSRDLVNDPEVLADSTQGWKLASIIESVDEMNAENISLLTNRVMSPETKAEVDHHAKERSWSNWTSGKAYVLSKIAAAPQVRNQDVTKMIRSFDRLEMMEYVGQISKNSENLAQTKNHVVLNHIVEKMNEAHQSPEKFLMEKGQIEHTNFLHDQVRMARSLIQKYDFKSEVTDFDEKRESCSNAVKAMSDVHNSILDQSEVAGAKSEDQANLYNEAGETMQYIKGASIPWNGSDLVSIFSTLGRLDKGHEKYPHLDNLRPSYTLAVYKKAFKNAEDVKSDVYQHLAATSHVYPYLLKESQVITSGMLEGVNLPKLLSRDSDSLNEEIPGWFEKMDLDALHANGMNILNSITDHLKEVRSSSNVFQESYAAGLKFGNRFMSYEDVSSVVGKMSKSMKGFADQVCVQYGTGGEKFAEEAMARNMSEEGKLEFGDFSKKLMMSPAINEKIADTAMKSFVTGRPEDTYEQVQAMKTMSGNKNVPQKTMSQMVDILLDNHRGGYKKFTQEESSQIGVNAMKNPQISWGDLKTLFDETQKDQNITFSNNTQFHPAFINPKHGSKLLRSLPASVPKSLQSFGLSPEKMQRDVLVGGKTRDKLTEAMQSMPLEGMAWPEFKRKFPKMENVQEIKDVFMRKNNKPVMAEDFAQAMRSADEKDKFNSFHVTYGTWSGAQRHNMKSGDNLVVQLNSSEKADMEIAQDPKAWALYQMILKNTNGISETGSTGAHPTTPHLVSWSRVDVSNKNAWIIEEFQSDAAQKFRANIRNMLKNSPSGLKLEGQEISPDEVKGYLSKIDKAFENWQKASMDAVIQNAKAHGIKKVYMHGVGIRSEMSGGVAQNGKYVEYNKDFINPRIKEIYDGNAQKFGFQKCSYTDYPNYDKDTLSQATAKGLPTHCWYLDIP